VHIKHKPTKNRGVPGLQNRVERPLLGSLWLEFVREGEEGWEEEEVWRGGGGEGER
jgi:hypothetical protein